MRKKNTSMDNSTLAITIAIATGILTTGCVLLGSSAQLNDDTPSVVDGHTDHNNNVSLKSDEHNTVSNSHKDNGGEKLEETPPPSQPTPSPVFETPANKTVGTASTTSAEATSPVYADNMSLETPTLSFQATFPNGAHTQPAFQTLMREMASYRDGLRVESAATETAALAEGVPFTPWEVQIGFRETARAGTVVSILGWELASKGGAHPNAYWYGVISNIETGDKIAFEDLFLPRKANSPAFVIGLCESVKSAKVEKIGQATIDGFPMECGDPDVLERMKKGAITLLPSTETGKFGGVSAHFSPYLVGVYAEGSYQATVHQDVFALDLRPAYKALFAGDPLE